MADSTLSSGDSANPHVIRCAECHELVSADRVRYREERIKAAAAPRPGQWRAGGPPIFRPSTHGPRIAPGSRPAPPPSPRNAYATARIPVCVDCLRRQRMGLYSICAIAAACILVAVALYSHEPEPPSSQQVALQSPAATPSPMPSGTATPKPQAPTAVAPSTPPAEDEARDAPPIWQPVWEAVAGLFASPSTTPTPISVPAPEDTPPPAVIASASPADAPIVTPSPPDAAPSLSDSDQPDAAPPADTPPSDVAETESSAPPIWKAEPKPARKVAKGSGNVPAASAVALRNNGYAALQQRHYREALTMLQQATMMGDAYAPMYIGQIFEGGIGVPRDVGQASYWYGIAINRGNGTALVAFNRMRLSPY